MVIVGEHLFRLELYIIIAKEKIVSESTSWRAATI